jgi:hypothetical protein
MQVRQAKTVGVHVPYACLDTLRNSSPSPQRPPYFAFFSLFKPTLLLVSVLPLLVNQAWEPLLPASALGHILEMLVMPKLRRALNEWEPRQETVPIHAWLFPWLPFLGQVRVTF